MILYLSEVFDHFESPTLTALYLDFEKAFDKVSHEKLIEKLQNNGITGGALELLESYLKGRKHRAKVGNSISSELEVKSGVPQGSVLGPLFSIIFINDLPECIMSSCFGYADDFKVIATNTITLQIHATRIWKWCSQNLMTLNISKCKTLNLKGNGSISMNGKTLEQTQKEKDLGIIVSNDLTWTANVERRCEKAIKVFFTIKRNIANGTSWIGKKNLYRSYIVPIISYGAILWKPSKSELRMIENLQEKASKWILGTNRLDYKDRLKRLSILPLSLYHDMHVLLTFVDILKGRYHIEWESFVQVQSEQNTRAQELKFYKTRIRLKKKQESEFWTRVTFLANTVAQKIGINPKNPKNKIAEVYKNYFVNKYNLEDICSWRLTCNCQNCRNQHKLK